MLEFVRIGVGTGSPLSCVRCGSRETASYLPSADVSAAIERAFAEWAGAPGPNLCLGGPEPFGHPELPALVGSCARVGAQRVALETDAAALSVQANARGVLSAGVRHLFVRLLAAEGDLGDSLGGRPDRTRDALAGVAAYLAEASQAGLTTAVTALVPVCAHNLKSLPDTVVRAASLGMHAVRLIAAAELPASAPAMVAAACDTGMVNGLWVETDGSVPLPESHRLHAVPRGACHV